MDLMIRTLARELGRAEQHVQNVVSLIDEGATIPFIARYRKELHGSMDDQLLRTLADGLQYLRNLDARKTEVKGSIENQGKLTEELSAAIDAAATLAEVDTNVATSTTVTSLWCRWARSRRELTDRLDTRECGSECNFSN